MFLIGAMALGFVMAGSITAAVTLFVAVSTAFLIRTLYNKHGVRYTYLSGLMLMPAVMLWPYAMPLLLIFPIFLIKPLEAFSIRNVMSMLLGMLTPIWLYLPYWCYTHFMKEDWMQLQIYYTQMLLSLRLFDLGKVTSLQVIFYIVCLLLLVVLTVIRLINSYKGKMAVRAQIGMYSALAWILALWVILMPSFAIFLLPLMLVFIGPIVAQVIAGDGR